VIFVDSTDFIGAFRHTGDESVYHPSGGSPVRPAALDELDRAILEIVQRDNQKSHAHIGEEIGLSPSSVRRRLTAMRTSGVIEADVSIVHPDKTMVSVIVSVTFAKESAEGYRDFKRRMIASPSVTQCYSVAGPVDFILVVQAKDLATYEAWGERELMSDPAIQRYDSAIAWSRVKFTTALPVEIRKR